MARPLLVARGRGNMPPMTFCALLILEADGIVDHRDVFFREAEKSRNAKLCTCVSRVRGRAIMLDTADR
jgi:hypothetical protein